MAQAATHLTDNRNNVVTREEDRDAVVVDRDSQYARYGGFNIGAAFFGWISASGIAVLLTAFLAAAGSAVAITALSDQSLQNAANSAVNNGSVETVGLISGLLLLLALGVSYFAGGYVAGRMSRFDGAKQGFGVWVLGIAVTLLLGALGAIFGSQYNIVQALNLPHLPIDQGELTTGGLIASILILAVTLLAAVSGGKTGENYHHKVDDAAVE